MAKTYAGKRKWTTGRSRINRVTDQTKMQKTVRESIKIALTRFNPFVKSK